MATNPIGVPVPSLQLDWSTANRRTTVRCRGRMVAETADHFKDTLKQVIAQSVCVFIDLAGVDYMDSSGVGALMAAYTSARKEDCDFQLLNLSPRVMQLLHTSKLNSILKIQGNLL